MPHASRLTPRASPSQAIEVSTLIPLKYACRRLILVGDPSQLPATVFSEPAQQHNYEQGLFQRLQLGGQRVHMLNMQYRMHPHISIWPGKRFYDGELRDAPFVLTLTLTLNLHTHRHTHRHPHLHTHLHPHQASCATRPPCSPRRAARGTSTAASARTSSTTSPMGTPRGGVTHTHTPLSTHSPYTPPLFTAFRCAEESDKSWSNTLEAQLALCIVRCLLERFPDQLNPASIGIIAPYNGQARRLCLCLWLRFRRG